MGMRYRMLHIEKVDISLPVRIYKYEVLSSGILLDCSNILNTLFKCMYTDY